MTMHALFADDGRLLQVFPPELVSVDDIPPAALEVAEGDIEQLLGNLDLRFIGGRLVVVTPPPATVSGNDINAERSRRILAGKVIDGVHVTGSDEDARNLMSLALGAQMRLAAGDTEAVTTFRDGDNVDHELTPAQLLSLWQQSAAYVSALYAASWALKAMEPVPAEYENDSYWPEGGAE